jgi:hypothetical protein
LSAIAISSVTIWNDPLSLLPSPEGRGTGERFCGSALSHWYQTA